MTRESKGKTKSEKLSSSFAENIFFSKFCFPNPRFGKNGCNELCDCLLVSPFGIIVIQVKESTNDARNNQERWYKKKIEQNAFQQASTAISAIKRGQPIFDSSKNPIAFDRTLPVYPIIVFDNKGIKRYEGYVERNNIEINVFSLEDFEIALYGIVTPREFLNYLPWRFDLMKHFENGKYPVIQTKEGFIVPDISDLKRKDIRNVEHFNVSSYIYKKYPDHQLDQKDEISFHNFIKVLAESDKNGDLIEYLSAFDYQDISEFWSGWDKTFVDDVNPGSRIHGYIVSFYDACIFVFHKCPENENLFPRIVDDEIHRSYTVHEFTKAFILVVSEFDKTEKYDIELSHLDLSIEEHKRDFLNKHKKYLEIFPNLK